MSRNSTRAGRDQPSGHLADGLSPIAQRNHQGAEVVYRANEDGADEHPQQGGQPAPKDRDGRSHDGPRAGDAGEMVTENHALLRGHIVHVVAQLPAWHNRPGIESKYLVRQPPAVGMVGDDESDKRANSDEQRVHVRDRRAGGGVGEKTRCIHHIMAPEGRKDRAAV